MGGEEEERGTGGWCLGKAGREMTEISKTRLFPQTNQSRHKNGRFVSKSRKQGNHSPAPLHPRGSWCPCPPIPPMKLLEGVGPAGEEGRQGEHSTQNSHCS